MNDSDSDRSIPIGSGARLPILGFGTWQIQGPAATTAVSAALEAGYRHIDTATVYENEREVGAALLASGIERSDLFITTKVPGDGSPARPHLEASLRDLATDYVDLWLIHWPLRRASSRALWEQMLVLQAEGKVRDVGVSNYGLEEIDDLVDATGVVPVVNQIPWSPFLHDQAQADELNRRGVVLEGYSPFKTSRLADPVLVTIATNHHVSPAQVVLRWHIQHRIVVIPKAVHLDRITENCAVFDFHLEDAEMAELDGLSQK